MIDFAWFVTVSVIALPLALGGLAVWAENGTSYRLVEVAGEYVPAEEAVPLAGVRSYLHWLGLECIGHA